MPDSDDPSSILTGWREAEQAATPGEWKLRVAEGLGDWATGSKLYLTPRVEADAQPNGIGVFSAPEDAEFTATARTAMPRLLKAAEAALKLAGEWRQQAEGLRQAAGRVWDDFPDAPGIGLKHARATGIDECARALREAITSALTGTQLGEDENHG